jgi:hypothetical protein
VDFQLTPFAGRSLVMKDFKCLQSLRSRFESDSKIIAAVSGDNEGDVENASAQGSIDAWRRSRTASSTEAGSVLTKHDNRRFSAFSTVTCESCSLDAAET